MESLEKEIENIILSIRKYMNGDESCYSEVLGVIDGLREYKKIIKKKKIKVKYILLKSRLKTLSCAPKLFFDEYYKLIMKYCHDDYLYYINAVNTLINYINICDMKDEYPDLDIAYILSIKLSIIFDNIMNYLSVVRTLESSYINGYYFSGNERAKKISDKEKEEIDKLLCIIKEN